MRFWWRRRAAALVSWRQTFAAVADSPEPDANVGEYQLLYKYLRERYANRVVLTFAEIEDLLGFALPASARLQREWWGGGTAGPASRPTTQSDSWTLASRTAVVNMLAQHVVFDRHSPVIGLRPVAT